MGGVYKNSNGNHMIFINIIYFNKLERKILYHYFIILSTLLVRHKKHPNANSFPFGG